MTRLNRWLTGTLALLACGTLAGVAATAGNKALVVTAFESAQWIPFDAKDPGAGGYAVLSGDPAKGPSHMLFRYGKAGGGLMHKHSSDYQAAVVKGITKHWPEGKTEADAQALGPGSYWSQPAGQLHADSCLVDECLLFITWSGKMD